MFSGIVEEVGRVVSLEQDKTNLHIRVRAGFTKELKIDQSIAHNGACLTVVELENETYVVTAIDETLKKTNLNTLVVGDEVNLERCMKLGDRLDGHIVQGHVDQVGICTHIEEADGSWVFTFEYDASQNNVTVEKGSVCVNGVSLTVVNSKGNSFSVCIIPYTYRHTVFNTFSVGTQVNLEFDIVGKYIGRLMNKQ